MATSKIFTICTSFGPLCVSFPHISLWETNSVNGLVRHLSERVEGGEFYYTEMLDNGVKKRIAIIKECGVYHAYWENAGTWELDDKLILSHE